MEYLKHPIIDSMFTHQIYDGKKINDKLITADHDEAQKIIMDEMKRIIIFKMIFKI
jgi:hypothetical protein